MLREYWVAVVGFLMKLTGTIFVVLLASGCGNNPSPSAESSAATIEDPQCRVVPVTLSGEIRSKAESDVTFLFDAPVFDDLGTARIDIAIRVERSVKVGQYSEALLEGVADDDSLTSSSIAAYFRDPRILSNSALRVVIGPSAIDEAGAWSIDLWRERPYQNSHFDDRECVFRAETDVAVQ